MVHGEFFNKKTLYLPLLGQLYYIEIHRNIRGYIVDIFVNISKHQEHTLPPPDPGKCSILVSARFQYLVISPPASITAWRHLGHLGVHLGHLLDTVHSQDTVSVHGDTKQESLHEVRESVSMNFRAVSVIGAVSIV